MIIVCDRFDFIHDLVLHLHQNNISKDIETYVQNVSPSIIPAVIDALLDVGCDECVTRNLLMSAQVSIPIQELVDFVEKRNT